MDTIYMLHAAAQSGKNTVADIMKEQYESLGKRVIIIAEADYVKYVMEKYYGVTEFKTTEGRTRIQQFATDQCRRIDQNIWSDVVTNLLNVVKDDFDVVIVPDWRFINEYQNMSFRYPKIVRAVLISRPDVESIDNMTEAQRNHQSEVELDNYENFDYNIINQTGKLDDTISQVNQIIMKEELRLRA